MSLNANNAGSNRAQFPLAEPGTYPARVVAVVDLGVQPQPPFQGQDKPPAQMVLLTYELLDEFMLDEDGEPDKAKPRWLSESFVLHNLKSERAKSTARYKALDPTEQFNGDFAGLLNTPCLVTLIHNPGKGKNAGKVYENVANVQAMRKKDADVAAPLVNPPILFSLDNPDLEAFKRLPGWVREKIASNLNFNESELQKRLKESNEEPF